MQTLHMRSRLGIQAIDMAGITPAAVSESSRRQRHENRDVDDMSGEALWRVILRHSLCLGCEALVPIG